MKKLLTFIATIAMLSFVGCSNAAPKATNNPYIGKEVSTYLIGEHMSVSDAKSKLETAGFEVIAEYTPVKKGTTLVFTNEALKAEGAKPSRAYASVLRLFIDDKNNMISITNPIYFGKSFMQDDFNYDVFASQLDAINGAFPALKESVDKFAYNDLAGYHFMVGMPYYEEPDMLGDASATTADAVAKAMSYKKGKAVIFDLKLSETTTLLGYDLGKRTKKFVKKIGRANAAILPWTVAIVNGQAQSLNAKYYIAISYPLLDMGGFMGIATVPGAITKDLEKAFKK